MTILSRLFLLVAVALLPAIAIQAYNEFDLRRARQVEVQNQALSLAKLAAAEQQQIVQGIRQVLIAMSELPAIKARDSQACNAYLAAMQRRFPAFVTFLVTDLNGRSFCDTNSDHRPITIAARAYFANILKTGAFTVGEYSAGLSTGRKVIQFALPFYGDDGRMGGVIVAGLSLDWLADYIARKGIPAGAALAITDRNGTYLARYPDNSRFVGKKMRGDKYLNLDQRGAVDILDIDGVERIDRLLNLGRRFRGAFCQLWPRQGAGLRRDPGSHAARHPPDRPEHFAGVGPDIVGRPAVHPSPARPTGRCREPMAARRIFAARGHPG